MTYSPNPAVNAKIHKLLKLGVPPIPVAPKLDPKHPDGHRVESPEYRYRQDKPEFVSCDGERVVVSGDYCKFTTTAVDSEMAAVRGKFVRLDSTLSPTPLFTGKNPSFLGWDGKHQKLNHGQFQKRMPTDQEIKKWFANPNTGVGTLGGHNGIVWVDFDAKNYPTQEDCDRDVRELLDRIGKPTLTEKTGSGGYRVAIVPTVKPTFTNFSTEPGGKHLGEALFAGRYTVLAPSKHPNGNYYKEICDADPVEVDSLEAIGLYPSKDEAQSQQRAEKRSRKGKGDRNTQQTYSDPVDNPWDIRNFALFFEGYSERGNGWGYAKCPAHNGTGLTSFRVDLTSGAFKCWFGCDTKAVYKAGRELAERFGYKFQEKSDRTRPETEHPDIEPDPEAYREYEERREAEERNAETEEQERQREWREQYPDRVKNHYRRHRRYTPTQRQNQRYVELEAPAPNTIMGVKSGLGTGKTEGLKKIKAALAGEGGLVLADRNGLLYQTCERLGILHLQRDKAWKEKSLTNSWLALCPDSLIHFSDEELVGRNLIIDEAQSVVDHILMGSTLLRKRDAVISRWETAVRLAKRIFLLDGYLTDVVVDYIARIRGGYVNIIKVGNDWKPETRPPVEFLTGSVNTFGALLKRDYSSFLKDLMPPQCMTMTDYLRFETEGIQRFAVATDTQIGAESLDIMLTSSGRTVLRIDSKTINTPEVKAFCRDPNAYLLAHPEIEVVIYTPTLESGFDVSVTQQVKRYGTVYDPDTDTETQQFWEVTMPYFSDVYGIFVGNITTNRQMQMLGRVRQCNRIHVFCAPFAPTTDIHSQFANAATRDLMRYLSQDSAAITADGLEAEFEKCKKTILENKTTPHQEMWGILKSTANHEKSNLRECLKDALIEAGYEVNEVSRIHGPEAGEWRQAREDVKLQNSGDRFNAEDISLEVAEGLGSNFASSWEERCQVWRAFLTKQKLPGIAESASWSENFCHWVGYEHRGWVRMQELCWLLHHPEVALLMQQQKWASRVKRDRTFLPDIRSRYLLVKTLRGIGITEFLGSPDKEYTQDSPEVISFVSRLTRDVQLALGIKVGKSSPIQLMGRVLGLIGFELKGRQRREEKKRKGERVRSYTCQPINYVDEESGADYRVDTLAAIDRKWGEYLERSNPADWGVTGESHKTQEPDVTPSPIEYIKQEAGVTPLHTRPRRPLYEALADVVFWLKQGLDGSARTILHGILNEEGARQVWEAINQHPELDPLRDLMPRRREG